MSTPEGPLTISALRATLDHLIRKEKFSPHTPVVLSADAEGNRFAPVSGWNDALYAEGETYSLPGSEGSKKEEEIGHVPPKDARKAVVLWPMDIFPGFDPFAAPAKD